MRRLIIFINIFICILFGSCNPQPIPSDASPSIGEIISRDAIASTSITNGTPALFNATGGATIDNQIFTYSNGVWQNAEGEDIPINTTSETTLTVICPAYSNDGTTLITNNPYANDTLQDVLIAQSTFIDKTEIQLKFRHLFSRLTIHVHSSIANEIEAVKITVPKVNSINPISGELEFSGQHTTRFTGNSTGVYSCIVPAQPNSTLTLAFLFDSGKEVAHPFTHTFVSGHKYECHVNRPGIRNAADLIAFSQFINDPNNKGKMHPEFGEKFGDSIVYRLLADIELEPEDCKKLAPIGSHSYTAFYDTFDGEGHTIFDLILPEEQTEFKHSGLFGYNNGLVQGININNASTVDNPTCTYIGIIASSNYGTINNCSVTNSTIHSKEEGGGVGLICAITTGAVVNCYSKNNTIYVTRDSYAGGIAGSAEARITNCYSSNNTFNTNGSGYKISCITGMTSNDKMLNIRNCYIYHTSTKTDWFAAIGYTQKASIRNFYYNKGELYGGELGTTPQNYGTYNTDFKFNNTHLVDLLNNWIDTTGKESYKEYTFRRWTTDADGYPCFE